MLENIVNYYTRVKDPITVWCSRVSIVCLLSILGAAIYSISVEYESFKITANFNDTSIVVIVLTSLLFFISTYYLVKRVNHLESIVDAVLIHQFTMPGFNTAGFEKLLNTEFNLRRIRKISLDNDLTINGVFDGSGRSYVRDILSLMPRLKDKELENKQLIYGGIALQPFSFLVGHIISNKVNLRKFEWNKSENNWYEISDSSFNNEVILIDETNDVSDELSIVIASSEDPISRKNDNYFNKNGIATFMLKQNKYDSLKSANLQKIFISKVIDFVKAKRRINEIKLVKLSFACQNSFPLELGRHWTLTELPSVEVLNFNVNSKKHEWSVLIKIGDDPKFIDHR